MDRIDEYKEFRTGILDEQMYIIFKSTCMGLRGPYKEVCIEGLTRIACEINDIEQDIYYIDNIEKNIIKCSGTADTDYTVDIEYENLRRAKTKEEILEIVDKSLKGIEYIQGTKNEYTIDIGVPDKQEITIDCLEYLVINTHYACGLWDIHRAFWKDLERRGGTDIIDYTNYFGITVPSMKYIDIEKENSHRVIADGIDFEVDCGVIKRVEEDLWEIRDDNHIMLVDSKLNTYLEVDNISAYGCIIKPNIKLDSGTLIIDSGLSVRTSDIIILSDKANTVIADDYIIQYGVLKGRLKPWDRMGKYGIHFEGKEYRKVWKYRHNITYAQVVDK